MSARVLVVDDLPLNIKVLEAKLASQYFDVVTAVDGASALDRLDSESPDIMLLDVMMPGIDGFEVCQRVKANPQTAHIPVVMVTALSEIEDRVRGLEAGADDFLTKPVNDIALFARVRSLVRVKMMLDELRLRERTSDTLGELNGGGAVADINASDGHILVVADDDHRTRSICRTLESEHRVQAESNGERALAAACANGFDLVIVALDLSSLDGLRLCSQLRSMVETRHVAILMVTEEDAVDDLARGLDVGVSDYVMDPIDDNELLVRVRTQIRQNRYHERLRRSFRESLALAGTDPLTGLYNRRYFDSHLERLVEHLGATGKPLSLLMLDIDFFKKVNDEHGHDVGDKVLKEFAARVATSLRGIDLVARYGGEEFMVVMPDTDFETAQRLAERLRAQIADAPFGIAGEDSTVAVTTSIGIAISGGAEDNAGALVKRADESLYAAKQGGRNRVMCGAA
jgi:two-component system cell cycle response regulator